MTTRCKMCLVSASVTAALVAWASVFRAVRLRIRSGTNRIRVETPAAMATAATLDPLAARLP